MTKQTLARDACRGYSTFFCNLPSFQVLFLDIWWRHVKAATPIGSLMSVCSTQIAEWLFCHPLLHYFELELKQIGNAMQCRGCSNLHQTLNPLKRSPRCRKAVTQSLSLSLQACPRRSHRSVGHRAPPFANNSVMEEGGDWEEIGVKNWMVFWIKWSLQGALPLPASNWEGPLTEHQLLQGSYLCRNNHGSSYIYISVCVCGSSSRLHLSASNWNHLIASFHFSSRGTHCHSSSVSRFPKYGGRLSNNHQFSHSKIPVACPALSSMQHICIQHLIFYILFYYMLYIAELSINMISI